MTCLNALHVYRSKVFSTLYTLVFTVTVSSCHGNETLSENYHVDIIWCMLNQEISTSNSCIPHCTNTVLKILKSLLEKK